MKKELKIKIYCEPCEFKGEGVLVAGKGVVCPVCGEFIYDSMSPEEYEQKWMINMVSMAKIMEMDRKIKELEERIQKIESILNS